MSKETFSQRLIQRMEPWNNGPKHDGLTAMEIFCTAIAAPYETILEAAEEVGSQGESDWIPSWGKIFDPTLCPDRWIPYLAMFVGVEIPKVATETEAREILKAESGLARGTRASLEALLRKALGAVPFVILERTNPVTAANEAYTLTIVIPTGHLNNAVYEEANLTIPAGIVWGVIEREGTWFSGGRRWEELPAGKKWSNIEESEL